MRHLITLDENDYLTFQLYTASKAPRVKKARIRGWILTTVTFIVFAYFFHTTDNNFLAIYFLVVAGLSLILFPQYFRWRYKRHYRSFVRDTYKNRFGEESELIFDADTIVVKEKTGELKLNKSEIEAVNEINDFYFLKTRAGTSLIISKSKTDQIDQITKEITSLIESHGVKHNIELDWKW